MRIIISVLMFVFVICGSMTAQVKMPAIFSNNMILQQNCRPALWGWAKPNSPVTIKTSWNGKSYTSTTDADGRWRVTVDTPQGSMQKHSITVTNNKDRHVIENVAVGEVWICSGQSNMDIPLHGVNRIVKIKNSNDHIINSANPALRLFTVAHKKAETPLDDCTGSWAQSAPQTSAYFSAIGYLFGSQLQKLLGVPVGMIKCAYSGTTIEAWMGGDLVDKFGIDSAMFCGANDMRPSDLYNGMVMPIAQYAARGFLWYQGEGNAYNPGGYAKMLPAMVKSWRELWRNSDMPFYYVQIAPFQTGGNTARMRQAMAECMDVIPHSGMVTLTDAGEQNDIHPQDKEVVAKRLLYWALAKDYGMTSIACCGPIVKQVKADGDKLIVEFSHVESGLTSYDQPLTSFEICGADSVFVPANATIDRKAATVIVSSDKVKTPIGVRYAFSSWTRGELFNFDGLPASSFEKFVNK